jgi:hypothetical protein
MSYQELLGAAQANPGAADFTALRMAYTESSTYAPYAYDDELETALKSALAEEDWDAALHALQGLLANNYLNIDAHILAAALHGKQGDEEKANHHRQFGRGLLESIFHSGNGRSFETAWTVISIAEEYAVCKALGIFQPGDQRLVEHEGHFYDVLTVNHPRTGEALQLYFNVDIPLEWSGRNLGDQ